MALDSGTYEHDATATKTIHRWSAMPTKVGRGESGEGTTLTETYGCEKVWPQVDRHGRGIEYPCHRTLVKRFVLKEQYEITK